MVQELYYINTGFFKLDGGAMFGVVPKSMRSNLNQPDENNMCTWAMRCLLLKTEDRLLLIDTGMGDKQDLKFRSHFSPHGSDNLIQSILDTGYSIEDVTDVLLTHLHFDHCGGAVSKNSDGVLSPTFPNATYWTHREHYNWAMQPNDREKASFLKENFNPLLQAGVLEFYNESKKIWPKEIKVRIYNGHTQAMMAFEFDFNGENYLYCADLIPSSGHISIPFIMSYDVQPLISIKEKSELLEYAAQKNSYLIFEHDPKIAAAKVKLNDSGRVILA